MTAAPSPTVPGVWPTRAKAWLALVFVVVGWVAWYLGQSGWLAGSPNERFGKIESVQAQQATEIEMLREVVLQTQATMGFAIELLCSPVISTAVASQGDRYLQNKCRAELRTPP
jgi:hypothetical protein